MHFTFPSFDIVLRPVTTSDVDHMMTWINDTEVTRNFANLSKTISRSEELAYVERMIASKADELMVIESRDGQYVGNVGLHQIYRPSRNGRLGLVVGAPWARGRGWGQQAMKLILAYGFQRLALHKVWLVHYESNGRMAHICKKLGFVTEGLLRDEYALEDTFHNMCRLSLLEDEFAALSPGWGTTE